MLAASGVAATLHAPDQLVVDSPSGAHVNALLGARDLWASEITPVRPDLERAFLDLTGEQPRRAADSAAWPRGQVDGPPLPSRRRGELAS